MEHAKECERTDRREHGSDGAFVRVQFILSVLFILSNLLGVLADPEQAPVCKPQSDLRCFMLCLMLFMGLGEWSCSTWQ